MAAIQRVVDVFVHIIVCTVAVACHVWCGRQLCSIGEEPIQRGTNSLHYQDLTKPTQTTLWRQRVLSLPSSSEELIPFWGPHSLLLLMSIVHAIGALPIKV